MALNFFKSFINKFTGKAVDWDELEETLIRADLGLPMTMEILDLLRKREGTVTAESAAEAVREEILKVLPVSSPPLRPLPMKPKAIMLVGVNGTGKTTSAGKLAYYLKSRRHSVLLVAADTFRAAAIEQLKAWGERIDVPVFAGDYHADPASVCYDAYATAQRQNIEFVICDTAGRLHTKSNLMLELGKVRRTLAKHDPTAPQESWLVLDATTGSNALNQAREFQEPANLTGTIVTKLDGSGKGGIVVAIQKELGISPRFIGTGEKHENFAPFERDAFVNGIL
ncbi:MAG: signal recognition particle-docking protein FtsY [Chthoniobacterales bacterium]